MLPRADEFARCAFPRPHDRLSAHHRFQKNYSETFAARRARIQIRAGRHSKNPAPMIPVSKLFIGNGPSEPDGISYLQFPCASFESRPVITVADNTINCAGHALEDGGPRVQHHIMSLVSLGGNKPSD